MLKEFRGQEKMMAGLGRGQAGNVGITEALHALMGSSGAGVALPGCLLLRQRAGPVYS